MTSLPKVLDLFSGIGGFSLAAENAGFDVAAHCEIEPFPQAVLAHRFPNVPIFEDVCGIDENSFYAKTGLFKIGVVCGGSPCQGFSVAGFQRGFGDNRSRLFSEQLRVARALGAEWFVWENVPGVLSSNGGRDFETVLCAFTGHDGIEFTRWGNAGYFKGRDGFYNVAYRILDSRFFGVPQRRRRIFLVASLGDDSCAKILFEQARLRGNFASGENEEQDIASATERGFGGHTENAVDNTLILTESSATIQSESPTLTASMSKIYNRQTPILFENHAQDSRYRQRDDSPTITSRCGTGGNNLPLVVKQHNHGEVSVSEISPTLNSQSGAGRIPMAVSIAENIINRKDCNGGNGIGALEENCYTLNATGVHAVASESRIRRLTPLECERLQGFPDNWTLVPDARDTNRYKACGNAITVNVAEWIFKRLVKCAKMR